MNELPQIKKITTNNYINEINEAINNKCYLSVLSLTLMIPDICSKTLGWRKKPGYVKWFNKYVFRNYYDSPKKKQIKKVSKELASTYKIKFNGNTCYALRNAILHSGSSIIEFENPKDKIKANIDRIELCVNSNSDIDNQYGESVSIITDCCNERIITIRINIINFALTMIKGYKDFLNECNINDIPLFPIIDLDNKNTVITFIPNK